MNVMEPGSYETELNATLADNNLPTIKITKTPNSVKLLSILTQIETQERVMETEENTPSTSTTLQHHQQQQKEQQQEVRHTQESTATYQEPQEDTDTQAENTRNSLHCKDIQLEFYTKISKGWPKHITVDKLMKGIEDRIYKFTYNEPVIQPHELM